MLDINKVQEYLSSVWPQWKIVNPIGTGSFGSTVYVIVRDDLGTRYTSALKVLQINAPVPGRVTPTKGISQGRIDVGERTLDLGLEIDWNNRSDREILEEFELSVSSDINMMMQLKGLPNIVTIEDTATLRIDNQCIFLIRMELLESLECYVARKNGMDFHEIIKMGIDICTALEGCEQKNILHLNINPSNIFRNEHGIFKLGDFGIFHTMASIYERMSGSRMIGVRRYMAPEIFAGEQYGNTADIYSVSMSLYVLLNGNNPPVTVGGVLSPLHCENPNITQIISKGCDPRPECRFQTANSFKKALQGIQNNNSDNCENEIIPEKKARKYVSAISIVVILALVLFFSPLRGTIGTLLSDSEDTNTNNITEPESPADVEPDTFYETGEAEHQNHTESDVSSDDFEESNVPVTYTILCRNKDGGILKENQAYIGKAGETITIDAPEFPNYKVHNQQETVTLSADSSENMVVFVYEMDTSAYAGTDVEYNTKGVVRILNKLSDSQRIEQLAESFSDKSGIRVNVETPSAGTYTKALQDEITGSRNDPTIFMLGGKTDLDRYGYECMSLSDSAPAQEILDDSYVLWGNDGEIYGLASIVESFGLTVNLRLLSEAGYQLSDIKSFNDLKRIAEDITSRKEELGFCAFTSPSIGPDAKGFYRFSQHAPTVPLFYELRDNDFKIGTILKGTYMDRFHDYIDLYLDNSTVSRQEATKRSITDAQVEFRMGKAVFHQDGSWDTEEIPREDVAVIPLYMGMPDEQIQGMCKTCTYYWCVNRFASDDDIEATMQFLEWMVTSEEAIDILGSNNGYQMPYKQAGATENLFMSALRSEENEGKVPVRQYYKFGNYSSWEDSLNTALKEYATGAGSWEDVRKAFTTLW